jgi:hypothetical protein
MPGFCAAFPNGEIGFTRQALLRQWSMVQDGTEIARERWELLVDPGFQKRFFAA